VEEVELMILLVSAPERLDAQEPIRVSARV
jgi:hypothetical protein